MKKQEIEINEEFKKAFEVMDKTSKNVFITGKAGTGKSTLLKFFRTNTKKKVAVLAPTGVAAININGQTIHSFFGFKPNITISKVKKKYKEDSENIYKKLDAILIDEISMVRSDLLDCVDKFLRLNGKNKDLPFGGTQMIFIGDLYQLPPVVIGSEKEIFQNEYKSEYFFDAKAFELDMFEMEFIELEKIYRQKDKKFIKVLNAIRSNSISQEDLDNINDRLNPNFEENDEDFYIYLTPTNKASQIINEKKLGETNGRTHSFKGSVKGSFDDKFFPTEKNLKLKLDSQVMMLNNDLSKRWVNGSIGKIVDIDIDHSGYEDDVIAVELSNKKIVDVLPHTWEIYNFILNPETNKIENKMVGSFTQYPMKLAWSVTIHKSQGKTFDRVILDIGNGTFAHGQLYVALSRCTSLDGIILKKTISRRNIWIDHRVMKFVTKNQKNINKNR